MKYIAYFFKGIYQFLGGTTTVLKVLGIFSSAFLMGVIAPVVMPFTVASALLVGFLTIGVDAYKSIKMEKKAKLMAEKIAILEPIVEALRQEKDLKQKEAKLLKRQIEHSKDIHESLEEHIKQFAEMHDAFCKNIGKIAIEELPTYARNLHGLIGDDLEQLLSILSDDTIDADKRLDGVSTLRSTIKTHIAHKSIKVQLEYLREKINGNKQTTPSQVTTPFKKQPKLQVKFSENMTASNTHKVVEERAVKSSIAVAIKTTLMMFSLGFGLASLGVAIFVGAPMVIAATMTSTVLAFSASLLTACIGLGAITGLFHYHYISPESKNFKKLEKQENTLLQEKAALQLDCKRYDKKIEERTAYLDTLKFCVSRGFKCVRDMLGKFNKKLIIRAKPQQLSPAQAKEIIAYAHPHKDKQNAAIEQLNKQALSQTELQSLFEQLPSAKQAMLMEKWHEEAQSNPAPAMRPS